MQKDEHDQMPATPLTVRKRAQRDKVSATIDDLPAAIPVTAVEADIVQTYLGLLLDELIDKRDLRKVE